MAQGRNGRPWYKTEQSESSIYYRSVGTHRACAIPFRVRLAFEVWKLRSLLVSGALAGQMKRGFISSWMNLRPACVTLYPSGKGDQHPRACWLPMDGSRFNK